MELWDSFNILNDLIEIGELKAEISRCSIWHHNTTIVKDVGVTYNHNFGFHFWIKRHLRPLASVQILKLLGK